MDEPKYYIVPNCLVIGLKLFAPEKIATTSTRENFSGVYFRKWPEIVLLSRTELQRQLRQAKGSRYP
jgi:hypothetical protein